MEVNEIYLGDAYELIKQLPDGSVDLIITDPPYQIDSLRGGGMLKEKRIKNLMDDLGENSLDIGIDMSILDEFLRVCKTPNIYIWMNLKQLYPYLEYFVGRHGLNWNLIIWQKSNAMPLCGGKYLNDCEYCGYFHKGVKLNTSYDTAKTVYIKPINIDDKNNYGHPTIKPFDIITNMVINSSNEGETVLDPFMGSGTTAVSAKENGRNYIGFEINPQYHAIAVDRLSGVTKKERERGYIQGSIFDEVE